MTEHTGSVTERNRGRAGITVVGVGSAAAPGEAFTAAADTTTRVRAILADSGVCARYVRTRDLTLGPRVEYQDGREQLVGYQAGQRLTVLLEGLAGIERLLTDVATLGGEGVRIDAVTLTASHPEQAMAAARADTFAAATIGWSPEMWGQAAVGPADCVVQPRWRQHRGG